MHFTGRYGGYDSGFGGNGPSVDEEIANQIQRFGNIRFSNFLITISTNVVPADSTDMSARQEELALTRWLRDNLNTLFGSFDEMNGNVLKPAGSPNSQRQQFPAVNRIGTVKSRIGIERGAAQRGQVHAHIVLEVMHRYDTPIDENGPQDAWMDKDYLGVHVNVTALREWLNQRIDNMRIPVYRRPLKVYVNSRLLTKNNDNANKWLSLAYISKDRAKDDNSGAVMRDLRVDRANADPELVQAHDTILRHEAGRHTIPGGAVRPPQMVAPPPLQPPQVIDNRPRAPPPVPPQIIDRRPQPPKMVYQRPVAPQPRNYL